MIPNVKYLSLTRRKYKSNLKSIVQSQVAVSELPDINNPVIRRVLTRREIADIPKDRYVVKMLGPVKRHHRAMNRQDKMEEKIVVVIQLAEQLKKEMKAIRNEYRKKKRKSGSGFIPSTNLFHAPIDEDKMADCIVKIVDDFFHDDDKCTVFDKTYNRMEFCVLMHIFFDYIHILNKKNRLPYSKFLQEKVFTGKSEFGERTYNTYASKDFFEDFKKEIKDSTISFKNHPIPPKVPDGKFLLRSFQEIGWAFHHSDYFEELRNLNKKIQTFDI